MTYPQTLLWQGDDSVDLGSTGIVGSVASEYFITYRNRHLYLWQVGDPPGLRARKTLEYNIVYTAENGAGVIAGLGQITDGTDEWYIIKIWADTVQPCNIYYEAFPIAYTAPTHIWVSGDGLEYVVRTNDATNLISGYSVADGTQNWEHDIFTTLEGTRRTGYVACAPRAGRYLWVNTSPLTLVYNYSLTAGAESMGGSGSTNYFSGGTLPDFVGDGETILSTKLFGRFRIGTSYYLYPTNTDELVIGGSTIIPSLSAIALEMITSEWFAFIYHVIPDLGPGTIYFSAYKEYANGSSGGLFTWRADWSGNFWTLEVTLDNSDRGGNFIELRDGTGAILDTIAHVDSSINPYGDPIVTSWVADVDDTVTYVSGGRCGGGGT